MKQEIFLKMANVFQEQMTQTVLELDQEGIVLVEEDMDRYEEFYPYIHLQAENKLKDLYGIRRTKQFFRELKECEMTVITIERSGVNDFYEE